MWARSEMIAQIADELGIGFIDIRLAQMDPVDLRGLPKHQGELVTWAAPTSCPLKSVMAKRASSCLMSWVIVAKPCSWLRTSRF